MTTFRINPSQEKVRIQQRMKYTDNAFHRVLICLERLEVFIESERNATTPHLAFTAIGTERDLHDDKKIPPTKELLYEELAGQCKTLQIQLKGVKELDSDTYAQTISFFFNDLLEWYGGRLLDSPFDKLDAAILPILVATVSDGDVCEVFNKYIEKLKTLEDFSAEERYEAVIEGWKKLYLIGEKLAEEKEKENETALDDDEVLLTAHSRGTAFVGYQRLTHALVQLFDDIVLPKTFVKTISKYCPDIAAQCPTINENYVDQLMHEKLHPTPPTEVAEQQEQPIEEEKKEPFTTENDIALHVLRDLCDRLTKLVREVEEKLLNKTNDMKPMDSITIEGVEYLQAILPHPYDERGVGVHTYVWSHATCPDSHLYIGSDAMVYCDRCKQRKPLSKLWVERIESWYLRHDNIIDCAFEDEITIGDLKNRLRPILIDDLIGFCMCLATKPGISYIKNLFDNLSKDLNNLN